MEEISSLLSTIGIPASIISLLVFILKLRPVTLISSSPIEKVIMTKEKRLTVKALQYIVHVLSSTLMLALFTMVFHFSKLSYYKPVGIILLIVFTICFLFFIVSHLFDKRYGTSTFVSKNTFINLSLIYLAGSYLLSAYYVGTTITVAMTPNNFFFVFSAAIFLSLILSVSVLIPITNHVIKFFNSRFGELPPLFVTEGEKKWFIYHPIENELILLGDTPSINDCKEFIVKERGEIIKSSICVYESGK